MCIPPRRDKLDLYPAKRGLCNASTLSNLHYFKQKESIVNAPIHGVENGKNLDDYPLENFCGRAVIYNPEGQMTSNVGVIFRDRNIDKELAEQLKKVRPRFVGLSSSFEFDVDIQKDLMKADIILYERLYNLHLLPETFEFYGMPLNIKEGDGSPVRAFAIIR